MQAAAPFPSVLLQAPPGTGQSQSAPPPPSRLPTQRPRAQTPPVPADWIRCSQCKKHKDPSAFPVRLINLIPYQVCLAHDWYWTEAKRATHWAPTTTISWAGLCDAARQLRADQTGAQGKWRVSGRASERESLVDRISRAGGWTAKEMPFRQSTAKNDSLPSPTWIYSLEPTASSSSYPGSFKLQLWAHDSVGCYTITLVPSTKGKEASAWARPGRARKPKSAAAPVDVETGQPARKSEDAAVPSGDAPGMAALLAAAAQTASAATSTSSSKRRSTSSVPSADRDREQMPPPPIPKKPRRVEPLLVSPNPTFSSSGPNTQTPFAAAAADQSWAHLFSFPTLQLPSAPPAASSASDPFPLDPLLLNAAPGSSDTAPLPVGALPAFPPAASSSSSSRAPRSGSLQLDPNRPLTLAELLSSAIFEPPNIDLPPRLPALNATSSLSSSAARTNSRSRRPAHTTARVRTKAGKELDEAVADALGNATPPVSAAVASEEVASSEEEGEGYYEDSIPDESSEEEEDDDEDEELLEGETPGGGADGASVSSFFESSAEETDYGSAGPEDDESDEDGEDNWLEGFAAQQMGLTRGETDDEEDKEEDEEDEGGDDGGEAGEGERSRDEVSAFEEDEENDELSDGEVVATTTRALHDRRAARAATRAAGVQDAEDEVDELDSPSGDEGP